MAFEATEKAKKRPIRVLHNGKWIGLGGDIKMAAKPPKKSAYTVKEATAKQYAEFKHLKHLVQEIKGKNESNSKPDKSDTTLDTAQE